MPDVQNQNGKIDWIPVTCLALALVAVAIIYFSAGGDPMDRLKILTGYVALILVFFYGLMVLIRLARNQINLNALLNEADGTASMSRFQLLVFTFIIGLSIFLMVVASKPPKFPVIPKEILTLLGISATTYVASKGIQFSRPDGLLKQEDRQKGSPAPTTPAPTTPASTTPAPTTPVPPAQG